MQNTSGGGSNGNSTAGNESSVPPSYSSNTLQQTYQNPQISELEQKILGLSDASQRDDVKLKTLQEIWAQLEQVFNSSAYENVVDKLMSTFLMLFCNTSPQFIAENNTQLLRKLILEIILRMSNIEPVKPHSKELLKQMMRLISVENEENAILAIKIIVDQGRAVGKMTYCNEFSGAMTTFKNMLLELTNHARNSDMFTMKDVGRQMTNYSEDTYIAEHLKDCFHTQAVPLYGGEAKYNLIPRASQSVRVLQEVPMVVVFFYQQQKHSVQSEVIDFLNLSFDFLNVSLPKEAKNNLNQGLVDDFCSAQSKILSFVNIMCKVPSFMEIIANRGTELASGLLQLLEHCPADLINIRKEVLLALKFFTSGELRNKFYHMLPRLISEVAVLGTGFTSIDNLKTSMYQMLADLLHHVRGTLTYEMLAHISFIFCRQLHDPTTNLHVQIMSARLLNSVTDSMTKMGDEGNSQHTHARDILIEILEALASKLKVIASHTLPILFKLYGGDIEYEYRPPNRRMQDKRHIEEGSMPRKRIRRSSIDSLDELEPFEDAEFEYAIDPSQKLPNPTKEGKHSSPEAILNSLSATHSPPIVLQDCKNLYKFIMQTCKFVTVQLKDTRASVESYNPAKERDVFERILKYGIMCMDVFVMPSGRGQPPAAGVRSKDEKETLESLANVFTSIDHGIFKELFDKYMDFLIGRIFTSKNFPLQLMVNTFLVRNEVPFFGSIMLRYLMSRMHMLTVNNEKTQLYMKLFKIIFSAIGTTQPNVEGEKMLKPFLPDLIRQATILALSAREPLNYFLLLRALFRSIGGGAHDILYGKFLPLLPNLLQFLNKLQSCQHRLHMRELFVELCLTVPVRLSSLLPYLPLLMDPLVCALNGSQSLVQQGLRTLELCVDNLQPEYLFEHMAPVRGALMQGLWRVIATSNDPASTTGAFRILGKFGGANRKMLNEAQVLQVVDLTEISQSYVNMEFSKMGLDGNLSIHLPLSEVMKIAVEQVRVVAPVEAHHFGGAPQQPIVCAHVRQKCMELAKGVLLSGLGPSVHLNPEKIEYIVDRIKKLFNEIDAPNVSDLPKLVYKCGRENDRALFINAIVVFFYGVVSKDNLRQKYHKFFNLVTRQFILIGIFEFFGGNRWLRTAEEEGMQNLCMDSSVLIDAMVVAFSDSNTDYCISAMVALKAINRVCRSVLPDIRIMSKIPFCKYLLEKILQLCHGPAWFARLGGTTAMRCIVDHYPDEFVEENLEAIVESLVEVCIGTVDEIASGSVDLVMEILDKIHVKILKKPEGLQRQIVFVEIYSRHYFHCYDEVRKNMDRLLRSCAALVVGPRVEDYHEFLYQHKMLFVTDIERTLNTAPHMSLSDSTASFSSMYNLLNVKPIIYNFQEDKDRWMRFVSYLLDLAQNETATIIQRSGFKKCESCAAHFLPPVPISEQIDIMRANAVKCLVACYGVMRGDTESGLSSESMEVDDCLETLKSDLGIDREMIRIEDLTEERHIHRILTVLMRVNMNLRFEKLSDSVHEALCRMKPFPLNVISILGASTMENVSKSDENPEHQNIDLSDIVKLKKMCELCPNVLTRMVAQNITNQAVSWKIDERIANTLIVNKNNVPDGNGEQDIELIQLRNWRQVEALEGIVSILASCKDKEIVAVDMAIAFAKFAADFEYMYSQDILVNWITNVAEFLSHFPKEIIYFFFSSESLLNAGRRSLLRRIIGYPESLPLRKVLMEDVVFVEKMLEAKSYNMETNKWEEDPCNETAICDRELLAMTLIDVISRIHNEWIVSSSTPIARLKELWNSSDFKKRYVVRSPNDDELKKIDVKYMTEHMYKVPKAIVNCFLRYLRLNHNDFELLFDVMTVFIGNYVTDFCYVREYLETEIIPEMPLQWRRDAFIRIMEMFETNSEKAVTDLRVVKTIQYLIIPCLQWAFERYDVDTIVGTAQPTVDTLDDDPSNLVSRLAKVIEGYRQKLSDGMVIGFYQLCTLFVQYAPHHIHNNSCKKQGGRLRVFMLFAWPCLTVNNHQDPTMRYTGFYFLANIIERFTINRKIVIQVFQCLVTTYQQDNRDQIRKAIDILTPAVPIRMEDGHVQIFNSVRKILIEECHNLAHIQHVFQMILRNYRVYFHVRYELLTPLMNAVQRALTMPTNITDAWFTRRMAIDVFEMIIKWDLLRNRKLEAQMQFSAEDAQDVDKMLENLKNSGPSDKEKEVEDLNVKKEKEDLQNRISKEHIDQIINLLIRFCVTLQQLSQSQSATHQQALELIKRSQGLLRAALKPCVWGEIATIRTQTIEKCLLIPSEIYGMRQNEAQSSQVAQYCNNAQYSLELLLNLICVMPKTLLLSTLRPLQRAIISCLNSNFSQLTRFLNSLVNRLYEKTNHSVNGLDELEILNQYITKYINDSFNGLVKSSAGTVAMIFTSFSLLRTICSHEPAYIETICINTMIKVLEKAAKEHISYVSAHQEGQREKNVAELLSILLELLKDRLDYVTSEARRTIATNIMAEVITKTNTDRVLESCLKMVFSMISSSDIEFTMQTALPLLVRIQNIIELKFRNCKELMNTFLNVVLRIYEFQEYRISECGKRLWEGFFWGLTSSDPEIREKFLKTWETTWPHLATIDMCQRMKYILQCQDWSRFKKYFWLRHALWSMLRSVSGRVKTERRSKRKSISMLNCAHPWKTFVFAVGLKDLEEETQAAEKSDDHLMEVDGIKEEITEDNRENRNAETSCSDLLKDENESRSCDQSFQEILIEQSALLKEAASFDLAQSIESVASIAFGINDTKFVSNMWVVVFKSFLESLNSDEAYEFQSLIVPFMSSGEHNTYSFGSDKSVLAVWLEALSHSGSLPSGLVQFIASKHECWHTGIKILEQSALTIPKQLNNPNIRNMGEEGLRDLETLESLAALYSEITEFDQFAGVWSRRAIFPETVDALACIQLGDMETASMILENGMSAEQEKLALLVQTNSQVPQDSNEHVIPLIDREYDLWMDLYINCCSELLQWQQVADICNNKEMQYSRGLISAAIHIPDWGVVEECRNQIYGCVPPAFYPDLTVYNVMLTLMRNSEPTTAQHKEKIKAAVQEAIDAHLSRWRSLPPVISYPHAKILQAMNIIREVEESMDLRCAIEDSSMKFDGTLLQDMKNLIKIWRSRTTTTSDELSFVSTIYDWRIQIHTMVLQRFEYWEKVGVRSSSINVPPGATNHSILPIHSAAQAQLSVAKAARALGFFNLSKDTMNKIAGMQSIPMLDAHQKVCDYAKTLRNMALATRDEELRREILMETVEVLEDVRIVDLHREQIARIIFQRANIHSLLDETRSAEVSFSAAAQLVDFKLSQISTVTVNLMKSWGHHCYKMFFASSVTGESSDEYGRQALTCYFTAARVDSEQKARKYIARILWIAKHLTVVGKVSTELLHRIIKQQIFTLNVFNWFFWLPQLISEVKYRPKSLFILILIKMVPHFPMQLFYYLRDVMPSATLDRILAEDNVENQLADDVAFSEEEPLSRLLRLILRYKPTDIRVFHRLFHEIENMSEYWVERHLRLAICIKDQIFSDMSKQMDTKCKEFNLSQRTRKIVLRWKKQLENDYKVYNSSLEDYSKERRKITVDRGYLGTNETRLLFEYEAPMTCVDKPTFENEKTFVCELSLKLIEKLKDIPDIADPLDYTEFLIETIKLLKHRLSALPKNLPLEIISPYLARFSHRIGCVEMPFDLLNIIRVRNHNNSFSNQSGQYVSMISRFEPKVNVVLRGGHVMRRFNIKGQTGKTCAFYHRKFVIREKTNRTQQLFTHVGAILQKDRETARRHLSVPMFTQLRVSRFSNIYEIASIQPYIQPPEGGTVNSAAQLEMIHPIDIMEQGFTSDRTPDDLINMFLKKFANLAKDIEIVPPEPKSVSEGGFVKPLESHQSAQRYQIRSNIYEKFMSDIIPARILYDYLMMRYPDSVMYFMMRKKFVHSLAVMAVMESHCNLSPMGLEDLMITSHTGVLNNTRYEFLLAPRGCKLSEVNNFCHEVPFRLTPNISEFIGIAKDGDLMWTMAATAKCLWKRNPETILRPLIWDEHADNVESRNMLFVCHATNSYVASITKRLENTNGCDAKLRRDDIGSQINRARDPESLSRMPPTYHPWF